MNSFGFPVRAAMLSEGIASGMVFGRWDAILWSIDKGDRVSGGLFDGMGDAWCSIVHSWSLGGFLLAWEVTAVGRETVEQMGSCFLKNDVINAACAANPAFFSLPLGLHSTVSCQCG